MTQRTISYSDALERLYNDLVNPQTIQIGTFFEFVRDIWSLSYDFPEFFGLWHVELLCNEVQASFENGMHYVAVLPRGHLKSTILGHAFSIWRLLKATNDSSIVYLSYSHKLATYHLSEIKKAIRKNPVLGTMMKDRVPAADYAFRYDISGRRMEIIPSGLFSFNRGLHVNGALIADDLLRDPENPLNVTQIEKVEEWFSKEAMYIPNQGVPIIVMGTPMAPGDLLAHLQDDERFNSRVLPVFNPVPDHEVLAPSIRSKEWLLVEQANNPKGFASEFMLAPYLSSNAYLNDEEIKEVENPELKSLSFDEYHHHDLDDYIVAGFDIGKKRHPSHLVIFKTNWRKRTIVQINNTFLDGWDFSEQAKFLNKVANNFRIDKGYFDNSRAELEDRDLDSVWSPIPFSPRNKINMAKNLESYVRNHKIELIEDPRQRGQITCVDNELRAPDTPAGHGDSFWSIALAVLAHSDSEAGGTTDLGSLGEWVKAGDSAAGNTDGLNFDKAVADDACPRCLEKAGWIAEKKLCLICYSDKVWGEASDEDAILPR